MCHLDPPSRLATINMGRIFGGGAPDFQSRDSEFETRNPELQTFKLGLPTLKVGSPQIFAPSLLWPNGWMDQDGPGDFVSDDDPALSPKRGWSPLPNFWAISIVAKRLNASRCHLTLKVGIPPYKVGIPTFKLGIPSYKVGNYSGSGDTLKVGIATLTVGIPTF